MELKIAILGYYGFGNAGDEAVLDGIVESLIYASKKENLNASFTVLSSQPENTAKRLPVKALDRKNFMDVFKALWKADVFILGGGSLFQDITGRGLSVMYYAAITILAYILRKKIVFYAQGVGPVKKPLNRCLAAFAARLSKVLGVRDNASMLELRNMGVSDKTIILTADPAFVLSPSKNSKKVDEILRKLPEKNLIGVMIRDWYDMDICFDEIKKALSYFCKKNDFKAVVFPMQKNKDRDLSMKLAKDLDDEAIFIEDELDSHEILALFKRFDLVLAMRLHALIFSSIAGVPMVGIGYDPKVNALLSQIGIEFSIDTQKVSEKKLFDALSKALREKELIKEKLLEKAADLKHLAKEFAKTVIEKVKRG